MKFIYIFLIGMFFSFKTHSQVLNVVYEMSSFGGELKNIEKLYVYEDKSRYVSNLKAQTKVGKLRNNQDVDFNIPARHRIIDFYFADKQIKEYALYRKNVFKAEWISDIEWVITQETGEYLGYNVTKAYFENEKGMRTYAWFTTQIPVSVGPLRYNGLPGLILLIEHDKINTVIRATEINKDTEYTFENIATEKTILISRKDILEHNEDFFRKKIKEAK